MNHGRLIKEQHRQILVSAFLDRMGMGHGMLHAALRHHAMHLQVMTVGGTKPTYNVDIYSGNHPFYQGTKTSMVMDEGMVSRSVGRTVTDSLVLIYSLSRDLS